MRENIGRDKKTWQSWSKNRHMGLTDKFRPAKKKVCNTCNKERPAKDFPMQTENMDGRSSKCRDCLKEIENQKKAQQAEYAKQFFTF